VKLDELNLAALLQAHQGQADASPNGGTSPQAWRREMEKAQADAWFHEALRTPQHRDEAASQVASRPVHPSALGLPVETTHHAASHVQATRTRATAAPIEEVPTPLPATPSALSVAASAVSAASRAAALGSEPFATITEEAFAPIVSDMHVTVPVDLEAEVLAQAEAFSSQAPDADARPTARPTDGNRLPVRVHIEGDARQATVWLGVDAAARPSRLRPADLRLQRPRHRRRRPGIACSR
jgi:hypothetical protein